MPNINTTNIPYQNQSQASQIKRDTFYNRALLDSTEPYLVHQQHAKPEPLPKNNGKQINFKRAVPLEIQTRPLEEGVTPGDGQKLLYEDFYVPTEQLGDYIAYSDLVDLTMEDAFVTDSAEKLGVQAGQTIDAITRSAMLKTSNKQYANGKPNRVSITTADVLNINEIRKAVRTLKNADAPKIISDGRGSYVGILSPNTTYDLQSDQLWENVSSYSRPENIFAGETGRLFGVRFLESSLRHVKANNNLGATTATLTVSAWNNTTFTVTCTENFADSFTIGSTVVINNVVYRVKETDATAKTFVLDITTAPTGAAAIANGNTVYPVGVGANGISLESTLIYGKDAYGAVKLDGKSYRLIHKRPSAGGSEDPLDQRGSVAWKVDGYAAAILDDSRIIEIVSASTGTV